MMWVCDGVRENVGYRDASASKTSLNTAIHCRRNNEIEYNVGKCIMQQAARITRMDVATFYTT